MSKKVLHICNLDKFIPPFVSFVENHFKPDEHIFWFGGDSNKYQVKSKLKTYFVSRGLISLISGYFYLVKSMHTADKVLLHGLFNRRVVQILFLMPWLLPKTYWLVWGGDLYSVNNGSGILGKVNEFIRKKVIQNIGHVVTSIDGDYENIKLKYNSTAKRLSLFAYPASLFVKLEAEQLANMGLQKLIVGNSAHPSNNHFLIFEKILRDKMSYEIICPLSYGDRNYRDKVIEQGQKLFGDNFIPLTDLIPIHEYNQILANASAAIFAHERQQAMSTIRTLLGLGKPVFMNSKSTGYQHLKDAGITLFNLDDELFEIDQFQRGEKNIQIISERYSEAALKANLEKLFND